MFRPAIASYPSLMDLPFWSHVHVFLRVLFLMRFAASSTDSSRGVFFFSIGFWPCTSKSIAVFVQCRSLKYNFFCSNVIYSSLILLGPTTTLRLIHDSGPEIFSDMFYSSIPIICFRGKSYFSVHKKTSTITYSIKIILHRFLKRRRLLARRMFV